MFDQTRRNFARTALGLTAAGSLGGLGGLGAAQESDGGAQADADGTLLSIDGRDFADSEVTYFFRVDGDVEKSGAGEASVNAGDRVDGGFVRGWVAGGVDTYHITGTLTDFEFVARSCPVHLGPDRLDPDDYGSHGFSALSISGEGLAGPSTYRFEVTEGRLYQSSENYASLNARDDVAGTVGTGVVYPGGLDSFEFTGDLVAFEFTGEHEAEAYLDEERVDPASY